VIRTYEEERRLAGRDRENLAELRRRLGRKPMIEVPHLHDDVHDLDGLWQMDEYLFGETSRRGQTGAE
jgi:ribose 1,5-bisphosphokinase PhnN